MVVAVQTAMEWGDGNESYLDQNSYLQLADLKNVTMALVQESKLVQSQEGKLADWWGRLYPVRANAQRMGNIDIHNWIDLNWSTGWMVVDGTILHLQYISRRHTGHW